MNVQWRIYYGDGATFDSNDGPPQQAPGLDVQVITQRDPELGRKVLTRFDWYYYRFDIREWWGSDAFGLFDQLTSDRLGMVGAIKAGRNTAAYQEILHRAITDPDFPPRSARDVGDRA